MTLTDRDWQPFGVTDEDYPEPDRAGIRWLHLGRGPKPGTGKDRAGGWLLAAASVLLLGLAFTQGFVSFHQQFVFVLASKHNHAVSGMEAIGLDSAAVIFAVLAVALARLGRPARIERALNLGCALGSMLMNVLGADLGSPRSIAVYVLPPVLYAAGSDRLISVVRRQALSRQDDTESQRSVWHVAGVAVLYLLRFLLAPPSTATGMRRWVLASAPVPGAPQTVAALPAAGTTPGSAATATCPLCGTAAIGHVTGGGACLAALAGRRSKTPRRKPRGTGAGQRGQSKTARFMDLVGERFPGGLATIDPAAVSRLCAELAPQVDLDAGAARSYLTPRVREAVQARVRELAADTAAGAGAAMADVEAGR